MPSCLSSALLNREGTNHSEMIGRKSALGLYLPYPHDGEFPFHCPRNVVSFLKINKHGRLQYSKIGLVGKSGCFGTNLRRNLG